MVATTPVVEAAVRARVLEPAVQLAGTAGEKVSTNAELTVIVKLTLPMSGIGEASSFTVTVTG
jgi:hypothetical protein